jgi:uncharacterized protein YbaR (Trm112 family)
MALACTVAGKKYPPTQTIFPLADAGLSLVAKALRVYFWMKMEDRMIDKELLEILACPETKEPVRLAEEALLADLNGRIERGEVKNRAGKVVEKKVDGGLVREDGAYLYPIEDEIPIMLIDEAIPLK